LLPRVVYTQQDLAIIATMMANMGVDGHRADLVILKAARAHAALQDRTRLTQQDILLAAELALPHRLKRGPLHERELSMQELTDRLEQAVDAAQQSGGDAESRPSQADQPTPLKKKR
jgi:Mg-chelatase subunit ChlI